MVVIRRNGKDGGHFPLSRGQATIGRHEGCDIRIALPWVSRKHAELRVEEGGEDEEVVVTLTNYSEVNPTMVNGEKLSKGDEGRGTKARMKSLFVVLSVGLVGVQGSGSVRSLCWPCGEGGREGRQSMRPAAVPQATTKHTGPGNASTPSPRQAPRPPPRPCVQQKGRQAQQPTHSKRVRRRKGAKVAAKRQHSRERERSSELPKFHNVAEGGRSKRSPKSTRKWFRRGAREFEGSYMWY